MQTTICLQTFVGCGMRADTRIQFRLVQISLSHESNFASCLFYLVVHMVHRVLISDNTSVLSCSCLAKRCSYLTTLLCEARHGFLRRCVRSSICGLGVKYWQCWHEAPRGPALLSCVQATSNVAKPCPHTSARDENASI